MSKQRTTTMSQVVSTILCHRIVAPASQPNNAKFRKDNYTAPKKTTNFNGHRKYDSSIGLFRAPCIHRDGKQNHCSSSQNSNNASTKQKHSEAARIAEGVARRLKG